MINELRSQWMALASKYFEEASTIDLFWEELFKQYANKKRQYHGLNHIHALLIQVQDCKSKLTNYDLVLLAIWYHDIIYKPTKSDNEEKSAQLAKERLKRSSLSMAEIDFVSDLILSTKTHQIIRTENNDNAYLLDIDLSILGQSWNNYRMYTQEIRNEYAIYPTFIYSKGRIKVLESFLNRRVLYFTQAFRDKFEKQARLNLKDEIKLLK